MSTLPVYISPVAVAIPFDGSTNGFIASDVQTAIEEVQQKNAVIQVSATADTTTTSGTDALLNTMSILPATGSYLAFFDTSIVCNAAGQVVSASLYVNGVQLPESLRKIAPFDGGALSVTTARGVMATHGTFSIVSGQTIEVRWSTSTGTATCGPRTFSLLRYL